MKPWMRKLCLLPVLLSVVFILSACTVDRRDIDQIKIEQTIGTFMSGYEKNNPAQIMSVVNLDESKKPGFQLILQDFLKSLHRDPYTVKIDYFIDNVDIQDDTAQVKVSAIMRIKEHDTEFMSIRLFRSKDLYMLRDAKGNWKINFKDFIPEELLKLNPLF